jgi:hypothetical protein
METSTADRFDILFTSLTGRSLKDQDMLWEA